MRSTIRLETRLSWIVCFITLLFSLRFFWPRTAERIFFSGPMLDWMNASFMALLITTIAFGAVRLTNTTYHFSFPARLVSAIVVAFGGLITFGLLTQILTILWGAQFIVSSFPYPMIAVPIMFLGDLRNLEAPAKPPPHKRRAIVVGTAALATSTIGFFSLFEEYAPTRFVYWLQFRTGNQAVRKVEDYRQERGHVPDSLRAVGFKKTDPNDISYQKMRRI